jgi:hypothetical protein
VNTSYKGTQRTTPKSIGEIVGSISENYTTDNNMGNLMKETEVDGLVNLHLSFQVAGNSEGRVILIPSLSINITGRDETNNNKQGTYAGGYIVKTTGNSFNGDLVKTNPNALAQACSTDEMIAGLMEGIKNLRSKEMALGYDKIWNIGK